MNLSKNVKVSTAITPTAGVAGTGDINGSECDMQGFDGVMAIVRMGTIDGGAVTSIKWQQDTATGMGSAADLLGSGVTVAEGDDDETFLLDLWKPQERFVRIVVDRGTANAVVASANYIQYGPKVAPTTQGTGVNVETNAGLAEGTA